MPAAKGLVLSAFGGLENLSIQPIDVPEPGDGEVLVAPILAPINPSDLLFISGVYGKHFSLPRAAGAEAVARVVKNGPGASRFKEGQRVVAGAWWASYPGGGAFRTLAVLPEKDLVAVPDELDDKTASQFYVTPVTVYGMLKELAVPKGEWLLQTAATSVLGRQVIQLAKRHGVRTINVVRRSDAVAELKALGADEVISTDAEDIEERVKTITGGKGAYAAIDAVAGQTAQSVVGALRRGGTYLAYGVLDPSPITLNAMDLLGSGKVVRGFLLGNWLATQPDPQAVLAEVMQLLVDKIIVPISGESFPLEQYKEAIAKSQAVARGAKVFIEL